MSNSVFVLTFEFDLNNQPRSGMSERNGTPVSVISEALGHRSEKVTYIYLAALDQEVIDKVNEQIVYSLKQKVKKSYNIPFI